MIYIFLALIFYTAAILLGTAAARNLNTNLSAAITNAVSAIIPIIAVVPILSKKTFTEQKFGILMAFLAGMSIAVFAMALNKGYAFNKVGIVAPIVFGGALFLSTILSYFVFKEKVSQTQFFGLFVLAIGLGIVIYARATGK